MNLLIARAIRKFANYPAVISEEGQISFEEIWQRAAHLAQQIQTKLPHRSPNKVPIVAFPAYGNLEDLVRVYAGLFGQFIVSPLNHRLSQSQLNAQVEFIQPELVLPATHSSATERKPIVGNLKSEPANSFQNSADQGMWDHEDRDDERDMAGLVDNEHTTGKERLRENLNQPISLIFTSGSSGRPKAVVHSLGNHYYSARGALAVHPFTPGDRWLLSLPLFHVSGLSLLFRSLRGGGSLAIPQPQSSLEESLHKFRPTHLSLVTAQLRRLLEKPESAKLLAQCKHILLGGGPADSHLLQQCRALRLQVFTTYGLTETASQVATAHKPLGPVHPLPFRKLVVRAGEIHVGGAVLCLGYIQSDGTIDDIRSNTSLFPTGDMGHLDTDTLIVTGRADNMFISGGENIHPEEIERAILTIEAPNIIITEAIVVGLPSPSFGMRPVAVVRISSVNKPDGSPKGGPMDDSIAGQLRKALAAKLAGYQLPNVFLHWPANDRGLRIGIKASRIKVKEYAQQVLGLNLP